MKLNIESEGFVPGYWFIAWARRVLRFRQSLATMVLALVIIVISSALGGCGNDDEYPVPNYTTNPSREDIIQAVRRSVEGKTYTAASSRQESIVRTCDQMDVDFDPYMPGNPELAKCPYVGATYTEWETVYENEILTCEPLPDVEDAGWYLEEISDNRWRVSLFGSVWEVEKLDGASASVGEYVEVSGFTFAIFSQQDC